jgi:hypothetical protein
MTYKITIYDPKTRKTSILAELPERRKDPTRPKGRNTLLKYVASIYGEEWTQTHKQFIGIIPHNGQEERITI